MKHLMLSAILLFAVSVISLASPPAVGLAGPARDCAACHRDTGPWTAGDALIVDLLDKESGQSLRQEDGSFVVKAAPGERVTFLTVIGYRGGEQAPHRNGWLFINPAALNTEAVEKFAPGWEISMSYGCRITGDKAAGYDGAVVSAAPVTLRAGDGARDTDLELQLLLTAGEAVKGKANEGLAQNYHVRTVRLDVTD